MNLIRKLIWGKVYVRITYSVCHFSRLFLLENSWWKQRPQTTKGELNQRCFGIN